MKTGQQYGCLTCKIHDAPNKVLCAKCISTGGYSEWQAADDLEKKCKKDCLIVRRKKLDDVTENEQQEKEKS